MAQYVYSFLCTGYTAEGKRVLKVGRTSNWDRRMREFIGLDRPDPDSVLVREVARDDVEAKVKAMCAALFVLESGEERFVVPRERAEAALRFVDTAIAMADASETPPVQRRFTQHQHVGCHLDVANCGMLAWWDGVQVGHVATSEELYSDFCAKQPATLLTQAEFTYRILQLPQAVKRKTRSHNGKRYENKISVNEKVRAEQAVHSVSGAVRHCEN